MTISPAQRKKLKIAEILAFIIACILGVLFHFVYEWTGRQRFVGFWAPVNESVWEHLKLIFYPIALVSVAEYFLLGFHPVNYMCIKFRSILIGMSSVIVIFYTYTGIWGGIIEWANIAVYFIAMAIAYICSYKHLLHPETVSAKPQWCIIGFAAIAILFMIFSVYPPAIGLFLPA